MVGAVFVLFAVVAAILVVGWPSLTAVRARRWSVLGALCVFSVAYQLMFGTLAEDAFITFRYAENIAQGHGAVFNVGDPVEGYSNFLLVVVLAGLRAAFDADVVVAARVIGVLGTLGCILLTYLLARRLLGDPRAGLLAAVLTATAGNLAAYGPSGMETALFALLLLAVLLAIHHQRLVIGGLLVALAMMTRPDGVIIGGIAALWLVVQAARGRRSWWQPTAFTLGALVIVVPWTTWRVTYYGHLLPNTVAAKAGGDLGWHLGEGWQYLAGYVFAFPALLLLVTAAAVVLVARREQLSPEGRAQLGLIGVLCAGFVVFVVVIGGDWMPAWRMLVPVTPLLAVIAGCGLSQLSVPDSRVAGRLSRNGRAVPALASLACLVAVAVSVLHDGMLRSITTWKSQVTALGEIGTWLGQHLPAGTVISTYATGALPYYAGTDITVVDQLGITDEHIARSGKRWSTGTVGHLAYDYEYVVHDRRPAVIVTTGNGYADKQTCAVPDRLDGSYANVTFQAGAKDKWVSLYLRYGYVAEFTDKLASDARFEHQECGAESG